MKPVYTNLSICLITLLFIVLALFLRFFLFGSIPPGLNRDEASIGYTSFSLLKSGKDEYGNIFPLAVQSFGDWKLPGYIYLTIPFVFLFGLGDSVVRLLSATAGIATIFVVYLLVLELLTNSKQKKIMAALGALTLGLLPWHIHFSRAAYEANLGLFFFSLATLFFLCATKKPLYYIFSSLLFSMTLLTYHTYQLFTPIFLIGLVLLYRNQLKTKKNRIFVIISLILFFMLGLFVFKKTFLGNQVKSSITFLTDPVFIHTNIEMPRQSDQPLSRLIYNKPVIFSANFIKNYLSSFSPNFLALKGGSHPVHNFPGVGNIFIFEYPLIFIGIYFILKNRLQLGIIFWWLFSAPIASSLTKDAPSSVRLSPLIIPLVIIIGYGAFNLYQAIQQKFRPIIVATLIIIFGLSFYRFFVSYFINFPFARATNWGGGYEILTDFLNKPENQNTKVLMQRPEYSPYIYFLYHLKVNPADYHNQVSRYAPTEDGFYHIRAFSRYEYKNFSIAEEIRKDQLLVVWPDLISNEEKNQNQSQLLFTVNQYGQDLFYIYKGKAEKRL